MNTTKQLQQIKLDQWAVLCKEQAQSGLTVKQWCDQNGYTIHTYNYWKHRLKEHYVESALHDIVPITPHAPSVLPDSHESHDSGITNSISILLGNIPSPLTLPPLMRCSAVSLRLCAMLRVSTQT